VRVHHKNTANLACPTWARSGRENEDALELLDTVKSSEKLIDNAIGDARAIVATAWRNRVELVKEENARRCRLSEREFLSNR